MPNEIVCATATLACALHVTLQSAHELICVGTVLAPRLDQTMIVVSFWTLELEDVASICETGVGRRDGCTQLILPTILIIFRLVSSLMGLGWFFFDCHATLLHGSHHSL